VSPGNVDSARELGFLEGKRWAARKLRDRADSYSDATPTVLASAPTQGDER
jgi:hypothetical protein